MGLFDIFSKKEASLESMNNSLYEAFGKVKQETSNLFAWVRYLRDKDLKNDWNHEQINYVLGEHDVLIKEIKKDIEELKNMIEKSEEIQKKQVRIGTDPDPDRTRTEPKAYQSFERRVIEQIRTNRKDYVLQQILNLAAKKTLSTKQIERIIVGEKMLCGRTTFYDYLRELRHKNLIKDDSFGAKRVIKTVQNAFGPD